MPETNRPEPNRLETIRDAFARQQRACEGLRSPFYADLLLACLADLEHLGSVAAVVGGPADACEVGGLIPLRFLGGVHRIVLERRAPLLALHYPSVGGDGNAAAAWKPFREVVAEHSDELREALRHPPQTNDVGRSAALVGGWHAALARYPFPIRLFEVGSSAGLNLRADRFAINGEGVRTGPADTHVVLDDAWRGVAPTPQTVHVIERRGCDLAPVDVATPEGRLRLTSFVWPDDLERFERLRGALKEADRTPATVDQADAVEWVSRLAPQGGALTIVQHSVVLMYLPRKARQLFGDAVDALGAKATEDAPVAHVMFEPVTRDEFEFPIRLRTWPDGRDDVLGHAPPHGMPTTWL